MRDALNRLFTNGIKNPSNIQYHHLVEQSEEELSGFSQKAINSLSNVVPSPQSVHNAITSFYNQAPAWLQGQTVRAWMSQQPWEVQWQEGLEIWKQAMTGAINWRPPF
jgi:hypothetical protein